MAKTKKELVQTLEVFEEESGVLKMELETLQNLNSKTLNEINQLHQLISHLHEDNTNLKHAYHEAQEAIAQLKIDGQSALEQCNTSHLLSIADSEKKIKEILVINQKLMDEKETLNKEMAHDRQKISDLQKKNIILFNQVNALKDEKTSLSNQSSTLKDDNNSLFTQTIEAKEKNNALLGQLNNAKEEIDWLYKQMSELQEINEDLSLERGMLQDIIHIYKAVCNSEEEMFLLLDDKLDVRFVSDSLTKRLHDNSKWEIKPLWNMISGIQEEKYSKIMQPVLIEKKQNKMKNIYLKVSPLVFMKVDALMFPTTYDGKAAAKVVFNERR
ncbi:MAG: hypothetical protein HQK62_08895 [Desulfamplus sp.]|nr:hypothetical protein [Desulfamplus sp.]